MGWCDVASLLGPQWLCECNQRGGAETVSQAGQEAAGHFLGHDGSGEGPYTVSVFKERNEWAFAISTVDKAMELAYPIQTVQYGSSTITTPFTLPAGATVEMRDTSGTSIYTVLSSVATGINTFTHTVKKAEEAARSFADGWKVGEPIELGSLTAEQASARLSETIAAIYRGETVKADFSRGPRPLRKLRPLD